MRDLLEMRPAAGAHRVAVRAAVGVAVPLLVLWAIGRLDWSIYACFGAFTSLFGRNHAGVPRLQLQAWVGLLLVGCTTVGTLIGISPARAWIAVPCAAALAAGATALSDRYDWHPPGSLFPIFALGGCASLASTSGDLLPAFVVSVASAGFSVLVGSAGALVRSHGRLAGERVRPGTVHPAQLRHAVRGAAAVGVAGAVATLAGIGHPYWAMVSAVVPLVSRDPRVQLVRGLHRVVGTAMGLGLSAALLAAHLPSAGIIVTVVVLQAGAEMLVGRNYAVALIFVTPLALLMGQLARPQPLGPLLTDRGIETLIGVVIGIAVGVLTRRPRTADRWHHRRHG
ncbi:FUSC family protein [Cumulibacter manganitolerans]|uniref:FUSC family protein n=1 Tax=Cumulibacter manganitolerans TaxID=1884992 RepID=UPI001E3658C3|nr:FUSC family protein [Cumulibacter manganitolerans]